jgi:hypothetical protein
MLACFYGYFYYSVMEEVGLYLLFVTIIALCTIIFLIWSIREKGQTWRNVLLPFALTVIGCLILVFMDFKFGYGPTIWVTGGKASSLDGFWADPLANDIVGIKEKHSIDFPVEAKTADGVKITGKIGAALMVVRDPALNIEQAKEAKPNEAIAGKIKNVLREHFTALVRERKAFDIEPQDLAGEFYCGYGELRTKLRFLAGVLAESPASIRIIDVKLHR